jgi:hypothetical protein
MMATGKAASTCTGRCRSQSIFGNSNGVMAAMKHLRAAVQPVMRFTRGVTLCNSD